MPVPNRFDVVQAVYDRGGFDLTAHDGCGVFCEAVVLALHAVDPAFGHLKKAGAQNQYHGHAVDSTLYRPLGQSVDFIAFSETPDARPGWSLDVPRYGEPDWYAPVDAPVVVPPVIGEPPPSVAVQIEILARLAAIDAKLTALAARPVPAVSPAPIYRATLFGYAIVLKPDGQS